MADDGGWPIGAGPESWEPGDARIRVAIDQLRAVFGQAEQRLAHDGVAAIPGATLATLIHSLDDLARRLAVVEAEAERGAKARRAVTGRAPQSPEEQAAIEAARESAMSARLDLMLEQLGRGRAGAETGKASKAPSSARAVIGAAGR